MLDSMARRFLNYKGIDGFNDAGSKIGKFSIKRSTKTVNNISIREAMYWGFAYGICDELNVGDYVFIHNERYLIIRYIYEQESTEHSVWLVKCNMEYKITTINSDKVDDNFEPIIEDVLLSQGYGYEGIITYRLRDIEEGRQDSTKYSYILPLCNVNLNDRLTIIDGGYKEDYTVSSIDKRALQGIILIQCTKDTRR